MSLSDSPEHTNLERKGLRELQETGWIHYTPKSLTDARRFLRGVEVEFARSSKISSRPPMAICIFSLSQFEALFSLREGSKDWRILKRES
jgi:hypothetical protein